MTPQFGWYITVMIDVNKDAEAILDSIDGFLLVDNDEKIVFMCRSLLAIAGMKSLEEAKGKRLRDVIAANNTYRVLETGKRQIGVTYLVKGRTIVSNSYPVYKDGKLIGALEYDVFEDADLLQDFVEQLSSKKGLDHFSTALHSRKREKYSLDNIKGSSSVIRDLKNEIKMAGRSNSTVLIGGETGTGKEMIARAIHLSGQRSIFEFVEVNCAAIPGELFESELFGYVEGSFTGARKGGKKGLAELADKGTLFLDEVNALPLYMQAKLLRFLQEREIQKVGGGMPLPLDVRVIAASNEDLFDLVSRGAFRQDLFYRLNVVEIIAEPLRKRKSDIPELVNFFMDEFNISLERASEGRPVRSIDSDAVKMLMDYDWPGNVRELSNVVERAMNRCPGNTLVPEHFPDFLKRNARKDHRTLQFGGALPVTLKEIKKDAEIATIRELINMQGLKLKDVAERLGISRQMLNRKMKAYKIFPEVKR